MHKGTKHVGKVPAALRQGRDLTERLKHLQKKLDKAVIAEDFEQAASLRDEIKATKDQLDSAGCPAKAMNIHDFLSPPVEAARRTGPHDRIVMSSRVRLARNLRGLAFPGWAKKAERVKALEIIRPAVESLPQLAGAFSETMDNLGPLDKQILVERHLISREHAAKSAGSGLVLNKEESLCVMINEEDHLRMQALRPGLQLRQAWTGH